jgi:integrase/recombinase XerD
MNKKVTRILKENSYLETEFISYLQSKDLAESSILQYNKYVEWFFLFIQKEADQITKTDVLKYLEHLKNKRGQINQTRNNNLIGLNHYFTFLHKTEQISANPCSFLKIRGSKKVSLYRTYTPEELTELYDNYYNTFVRTYDDSHIPKNQRKQSNLSKTRNAVILNILIHQGATTKEIDLLELCDLDLMGASIKLRAGKKSNSRVLPLQATQIGVLMVYLQTIRPELENYQAQESEKLFLPLPETSKSKTDSSTLMHVFKPLTKHLTEIDKNFLSFKQIRASVITNWLKVHGLRKTQVLAGHRYISSTEKYKANDLQQLTEDISKLHPFQ